MTTATHKLTLPLILEAMAVIFSLLYTWLYIQGSWWCWPSAITAGVLFLYLVWFRQLYAESLLHLFYIGMAIYGWMGVGKEFPLTSWPLGKHLLYISLGAVGVLIAGTIFKKFSTAKIPYIDSFTTIFSVIATFMMIHYIVENWWYWIIIDSVSVYLYYSRGLKLSALLYVIYTGMAVYGLTEQYY